MRQDVQLTGGNGRDRSSVTQFTARDFLQHEREKGIRAESVSKAALRLLHVNTFVLELCQRYCGEGGMIQVFTVHGEIFM